MYKKETILHLILKDSDCVFYSNKMFPGFKKQILYVQIKINEGRYRLTWPMRGVHCPIHPLYTNFDFTYFLKKKKVIKN